MRTLQQQVELDTANMSCWGHLKEAAICLFSFNISEAFIEVVWAVSRALHIGDYGKTGYFTRLIKLDRLNHYDE